MLLPLPLLVRMLLLLPLPLPVVPCECFIRCSLLVRMLLLLLLPLPSMQSDKENRCCVCGLGPGSGSGSGSGASGPGSGYLRHNIVPHCYRQHFPPFMKSHLSHDIVLLCLSCHQVRVWGVGWGSGGCLHQGSGYVEGWVSGVVLCLICCQGRDCWCGGPGEGRILRVRAPIHRPTHPTTVAHPTPPHPTSPHLACRHAASGTSAAPHPTSPHLTPPGL